MKQLLKFKQEIIKEIQKEDKLWHCKLCNKDFPSSAYCVESHFSNVHHPIEHTDWSNDDIEQNWKNVDVDDFRAIKCVNRVYNRFMR